MMTSLQYLDNDQVSTGEIDAIAQYLQAADATAFRTACEGADRRTFPGEIQRFFSTWTTNLMGLDLQKLESVSQNPWSRNFVKKIHIEENCEANDPWNISEPLRSNDIWPRDDLGNVISSQIGVASLRTMLEKGFLQPEMIKIRDYRIDQFNFELCPVTTRVRGYRIDLGRREADFEAVSALARDLTEGVDTAMIAVDIQLVKLPLGENNILNSGNFTEGGALGEPCITEVRICLSPEHQGQSVGLSMLRSAQLRAIPYWTQLVLDCAPELKDLEISNTRPGDALLITKDQVAKLKRLRLNALAVDQRTVLAILADPKDTLTTLHLKMMKSIRHESWRDLLSILGRNLPKLTYFHLAFLRQNNSLPPAVGFLGFTEDEVPEHCRPGLDMPLRGPPENERLTRITYQGPDAGYILAELARYASYVP